MANRKKISGRVAREVIRAFEISRLPEALMEGYRKLENLVAPVSDAMDLMGLEATVPSSVLRPVIPGARAIGQAITVRNIKSRESMYRKASEKIDHTGSPDAFNIARRGDIIVIEGLMGVSNLGGHSATICHRMGFSAAVVDGSVRDPEAARKEGFPMWVRGTTPVTGKWRYDTVEINGTISMDGVQVVAGDLVLADDSGVVFVPFKHAAAVLAGVQKIALKDKNVQAAIEAGVDLFEMPQIKKRR
jgi:regulator of RNase E activity RraA